MIQTFRERITATQYESELIFVKRTFVGQIAFSAKDVKAGGDFPAQEIRLGEPQIYQLGSPRKSERKTQILTAPKQIALGNRDTAKNALR